MPSRLAPPSAHAGPPSKLWLHDLIEVVAGQGRALAFMAAAVFLLVLFRQIVSISLLKRPVGAAEFSSLLVGDFLVHLMSGVVMWLVIQPIRHIIRSEGLRRAAVLVVAILFAAAVAAACRALYLVYGQDEPMTMARIWPGMPVIYIRFATLGAMLVAVAEFHRSEVLSIEAMRAAEADRSMLEQQTLQARLKTLEAQIEPHFLFNTLANVRRLYDTDLAAGEAMLERFMRYLEIALPTMRGDRSTLAREAELIEAFLDLQKVRMGRRLSYRVDIAAVLRHLEVPPMMLLTLVENAIKHGLAPQRDGGSVEVSARLEGPILRLEVADTGRGFGVGTSGGGTGLANIRARLTSMFGAAAGLTLTPRQPRGLIAEIRMPAPAPT